MILMRRKVYSVEKELSFQQMALEQLDVCMQKKWTWIHTIHHMQKINSKWIIDLHVKPKVMKSSWPLIWQRIFSYDTNNTILNRKLYKSKTFPLQKTPLKELKIKLQLGRKYLQSINLIKDLKSSQNFIIRK